MIQTANAFAKVVETDLTKVPTALALAETSVGEPLQLSKPERSRTEFEVVCRMVIAGRRWRSRLNERMKDHQQTDARWSALYGLSDSPDGVIQNELADRLGVKGPSLVKLLDALEAQGLVKRRAAAGDRRANQIVLEPRGREVLDEVDEIAAGLRAEMFAEFTDAELETTGFVLSRLASKLAPT